MSRSVKLSFEVCYTQRNTEEIDSVACPRQPPMSSGQDKLSLESVLFKYNAHPEKNCAHWTKVSSRMHSNRGLPSLRISRRGFRLEMKYGTVMVGEEWGRLGCVSLASVHHFYTISMHATVWHGKSGNSTTRSGHKSHDLTDTSRSHAPLVGL